MGMPTNQLVHQRTSHIVNRERIARILLSNPSVKEDLQKHIPQLLTHGNAVIVVNSLDQLEALFDQIPPKRSVSLFGIPRTTTGRPEAVHHRHRFEQALALGHCLTVLGTNTRLPTVAWSNGIT
jgi:hypothetical protein